MSEGDVRKVVRERYGQAAKRGSSCCSTQDSCCSSDGSASKAIGYSDAELASIPEGADLGLGCGNPTALAGLKEGEVVLDLGSGAGIDCFLAAQAVGVTGRAIGVDMTHEMLDRARENARKNGIENVEFRLGEIEHLPVADGEVDVVISNCVINLSPDKPQVFREAHRVLKPGGRVFVSDIVQLRELPQAVKNSIEAYVGCIAGASMKADYLAAIEAAGFRDVAIHKESVFGLDVPENADATLVIDGEKVSPESIGLSPDDVKDLGGAMASIAVEAVKRP
jgi:arsenite methyltransferase